ncbi:hypothetical protein [Nocardia sp. MW-W600-9]
MTRDADLALEHRWELALDYGQFVLHGGEGEEDTELALLEAALAAGPSAGDEPIAALADVYSARELAGFDRALAESIAEMDAGQLRALSVFCAERAYEYAGLADRPWVRPALAALRSGDPFPEHFQDASATFARLDVDEYGPDAAQFESTVRIVLDRPARSNPYDRGNISRPHYAVNTLFHARLADPLQGALSALNEAAITFGDQVEVLFAGIRAEFGLPPRH